MIFNNKNVSLIISEYNPFHNGHLYHIEKTKKLGADYVIAIISGSFSQRGLPCIVSKWARTKMALLNGIDLVIELPSAFSMSTAENFAKTAVFITDSLGIVDNLSFGSELGDINLLIDTAKCVQNENIMKDIKYFLKEGLSYAASREKAILKNFSKKISDVLKTPNNILAVEYIKALNNLNSNITPVTIKRTGAQHDSDFTHENFASASYIREKILSKEYNALKNFMPLSSFEILMEEINNQTAPANIKFIERAILSKLRSMSLEKLKNLPDISEGLEFRLYKKIKNATSLNQLISDIKTKRYTYSRILRIIMSAFIDLNKNLVYNIPSYVKILGFNDNGINILREIKKYCKIPIITKYRDVSNLSPTGKLIYQIENKATDLMFLSTPEIQKCCLDITTSPIKL